MNVNIDDKRKKHIEAAEKSLKRTKETMEFWQRINEMLEHLHRPVLHFLQAVTLAIPPLKLAVGSLIAIWDVATTALVGKESKIHKAEKIGFAITGAALATTAFAAPIAAGAAFVAGASVTLVKDCIDSYRSIKTYRDHKKKIKLKSHELRTAHSLQDHNAINKHQQALHELHLQTRVHRSNAVNKTVQPVLGAMALVGAAMLVTPLAPIGGIVLLASAALGVAHKVGSWWRSRKIKQQQATIKPAPTQQRHNAPEHTHQETETGTTDLDDPGIAPHLRQQHESTTDLYMDIAEQTHDATHTTKQEAIAELKHSTAAIQPANPQPHPAETKTLSENHNELFNEIHTAEHDDEDGDGGETMGAPKLYQPSDIKPKEVPHS